MKFPLFVLALSASIATLFAFPASATTPVVTVTSPAPGAKVTSPVNYVATASSSGCAKGIAAIRIYPSPGFNGFTTNSASLNANIDFQPASTQYNTVVQAWDNCGGVGKTTINITVTGTTAPRPRFLYSSDFKDNKINGFIVNINGAPATTIQKSVALPGGPTRVASDKGGFRLYAVTQTSKQLAGFFIDRNNGALTAVPGSPVSIGSEPLSVAVAPSGKFVYVTTNDNGVVGFAVQSNGSLVKIAGSPFPTQELPETIVVSPTGGFAYVADFEAGKVDAYSINSVSGALTPVPGEPYSPPNGQCAGCTDGGAPIGITTDRAGNFVIVPGFEGGGVNVYKIDHANGSLSLVPGSPFISRVVHQEEHGPEPYTVTVDAQNRFVYLYEHNDEDVAVFSLNSTTGQLTLVTHNFAAQECGGDQIVGDPSGSFVYGTTDAEFCPSVPQGIYGLSINQSNGNVTPIPGSPLATPENGIGQDGLTVTP